MASQTKDSTAIGEQQEVRERRGVDDLVDEVLVAQLRPLHAAAPTALGAEGVGRDRLDVPGAGHGEDDLLVLDEVFNAEFARVVHDLGETFLGVLVA